MVVACPRLVGGQPIYPTLLPCLAFCVFSIPAAPGVITAFDLYKNWNEVFTLKTRAGEFACFDAMKASPCSTFFLRYRLRYGQSC